MTRALLVAAAILTHHTDALAAGPCSHACIQRVALKQHWHKTGASTFGGPCEPSETIGYRGDDLRSAGYSFAELGNGAALGGLPYRTALRVINPATHRALTIRKRDIGGGGSSVFGLPRTLDLYWTATHALDPRASCSSWTGVIWYRRLR